MAIGTTAALIGSAVIGAGASAIGASKNSKAISKASDAQTAANDRAVQAQENARRENLALQQPIYNAGMPAINARNALLGIGGTQQQAPHAANNNSIQPNWGAGFGPGFSSGMPNGAGNYGNMNALASFNPRNTQDGIAPAMFGMDTLPNTPFAYNRTQPYAQTAVQQATGAPQTATGGQTAQQGAQDAFQTFRDSTGYQFRLNEGMDALNSGWAGAGTLQSGAAMRSALDYGQNMASAEFGNYWNMLGEQQNLSSGAANAMSGVNTTYANNAGNLAIANGQNLANAAIARGNNSNMMLGGFANALGTIAGSGIFGK